MKINKLPMIYSSLMKHQLSYLMKKTCCSRTLKRDFTLGSCFLNEVSKLSFTGIEHIQSLQSISKKNKKLSKVDEKDLHIVEELKKGSPNYPYASPGEKTKTILVEDGKVAFRKAVKLFTQVELGKLELEFFPRETDILIIGSGPVGLLIAYTLRNQCPHGPKIMVIDKDDTYPRSSLNLGQGIVTQQLFNEEEEIPLMKYGLEFFSSFSRRTDMMSKPECKLPYDPLGSLILADMNNADTVMKNNETLKLYGINNKIVSVKTLKEKFPWLNLDDVLFGSLGMYNEGVIDPWAFLNGIRSKCINVGVEFITAEVIDFGFSRDDIKRAICKLPNGTYNSIDFAYCVLACGIEALNLVDVFNSSDIFNFGLKLPLDERMRFEYCFYTRNGPGVNTPIVVDSEGTYLRREGLTGHYVTGVPSVIYKEGECSPYQTFESKIKPFLVKRVPHLDNFELAKGWIHMYDFCFSNNIGITGPHPETDRIVFALGFTHQGLLLLPALARAVMEFILYETYQTIDFQPFHIENLWRKQHLEADRKRRELLESEQKIAISS